MGAGKNSLGAPVGNTRSSTGMHSRGMSPFREFLVGKGRASHAKHLAPADRSGAPTVAERRLLVSERPLLGDSCFDLDKSPP